MTKQPKRHAVILDNNTWLHNEAVAIWYGQQPFRKKSKESFEKRKDDFWWVVFKLYNYLDELTVRFHYSNARGFLVYLEYKVDERLDNV